MRPEWNIKGAGRKVKDSYNIIGSFYPKQFILLDYLRKVDTNSCLSLIKTSDPSDYLDILNKTTVAVPEGESVASSVLFKPTRRLSLRGIVLDVIENVRYSKSSKTKENVLAFGYEAVGENNKQGTVSGAPRLKNTYINSAVDYILSEPWKLLHERVGDDMMFHLLTRVALFIEMPSKCYLQVSGNPITQVLQLTKEQLKFSHPVEDLSVGVESRKRKRCKSDDSENTLAAQDGFHGEQSDATPRAKRRKTSNEIIKPVTPKDGTCTLGSYQEEPKIPFSQKRKTEDDLVKQGKQKHRKLNAFRRKVVKKPVFSTILQRVHLPRHITYDNTRSQTATTKVPTKSQKRKEKPKPGKRLTDETNASWNKRYFPTSSVLYSSTFKQQLPSNHIFESSNSSKAATRKVIKVIFLNSNSKNSGRKKRPDHLPRRFINMTPLFLNIIKRHKCCPFRSLLKHHCPWKELNLDLTKRKKTTTHYSKGSRVQVADTGKRKKQAHCDKREHNANKPMTSEVETNLIYQNAAKSYNSHHQVTRFLCCVCNKVIPLELWGCEENRRHFLKNLGRFVSLHKGEKFTLAQMMNGIKVSECHWLKSKGYPANKPNTLWEFLKQREILGQFVWWFVCKYLMVVLKSFFYITESGMHRNQVFYYRKPVWKRISNYGIQNLESVILKPLTKSEAKEILMESPWGFSTMRFLPKARTVRPIINMNHSRMTAIGDGKQTGNPQGKSVSINWKLKDAFKILTFEKERNPAHLGSSLFGVDDIYKKLKPFIVKRQAKGDLRPLYITRTDVSGCYESIEQSKLCDILEGVLQEEEYFIRQFHVLSLSSNGTKVKKIFQKHVSDVENADLCFIEFLDKQIDEAKLNNVVVVDYVRHITKDKENVLDLLKQHILCCVVKIGNQFYHKNRGIAQGSCVSAIFCNCYYGSMEKDHFQDISSDEDSLLLRWIDDFLLLTPHLELANQFLLSMHSGIPEYGCYVNSAKSLVNFDAVSPDGNSVKRVSEDEKFPWCGFLLDQQTLEVQCDYSRYDGCHVNDTITSELNKHPGLAVKLKLQHTLSPKCHPLLLDPQINARDTVLTNLYQAFLLTACKCHAQVRKLPRGVVFV